MLEESTLCWTRQSKADSTVKSRDAADPGPNQDQAGDGLPAALTSTSAHTGLSTHIFLNKQPFLPPRPCFPPPGIPMVQQGTHCSVLLRTGTNTPGQDPAAVAGVWLLAPPAAAGTVPERALGLGLPAQPHPGFSFVSLAC